MRCRRCGVELLANTEVCRECGAEVIRPKSRAITLQEYEEMMKTNEKKTALVLGALTVIAIAAAVAAFVFGYAVCGIVALVQAMIFAAALVMELKLKEERFQGISSKLEIFGLALTVFVVGSFLLNSNTTDMIRKRYSWPVAGLAQNIVKPESEFGKIQTDTDDQFIMDVFAVSEDDYQEYAQQCFDAGYSVDYGAADHSMVAYNEKGIKLELYYDGDARRMNISLAAARHFAEIIWPDKGIGAMAPAPSSTIGEVVYNIEEAYCAYVAESSREDYLAYIEACKAHGFNQQISEWGDYFTANDENGNTIIVTYQGNNSFYVNVHTPQKS